VPARSYHHGNLRRALLDGALSLFAERNDFDFTFRELARAAGVTHNAPYRHFAGRAELLDALTDEGLDALATTCERALADAGTSPRERVRALGEAYVRFALDEPVHFRLVLAHPVEGAPHRRRGKAFALLEKTLEEARAAGAVRSDLTAREIALAAWALVHGAASLLASGQVPTGPARMRAMVDVLAAIFFDGAGAKPKRRLKAARASSNR
jgi:AcrR family transcriptional regulator